MKASDRFFLEGVSCVLDGRRMPVANLSLGGFFAATPMPPLTGQALAIELELPGQPSIPLVARVTWINDPQKPRARRLPEGFGVKITEIGLSGKLALVELLKRSAGQGPRRREAGH